MTENLGDWRIQEGPDGEMSMGIDTRPFWVIQALPKHDLNGEWEDVSLSGTLDPQEARFMLKQWQTGENRRGACSGYDLPVSNETHLFRAMRCQFEDW